MHGSYLQGMETIACVKHDGESVSHGSYLQGMETVNSHIAIPTPAIMHGSYLQGMETVGVYIICHGFTSCTDPTYKEWKRVDMAD